jgi:hypothetical protein
MNDEIMENLYVSTLYIRYIYIYEAQKEIVSVELTAQSAFHD